jgi:hypothetical protein
MDKSQDKTENLQDPSTVLCLQETHLRYKDMSYAHMGDKMVD